MSCSGNWYTHYPPQLFPWNNARPLCPHPCARAPIEWICTNLSTCTSPWTPHILQSKHSNLIHWADSGPYTHLVEILQPTTRSNGISIMIIKRGDAAWNWAQRTTIWSTASTGECGHRFIAETHLASNMPVQSTLDSGYSRFPSQLAGRQGTHLHFFATWSATTPTRSSTSMLNVPTCTMPIWFMHRNGQLITNNTVAELQTTILRIPMAKNSTTKPYRLEHMGCDTHNGF